MQEEKKYPFLDVLKYRFNLDEDKAEESTIISSIIKNIEFKGVNLWTLIFAIFIASIGLNVNSTAVIIGAMLISPLMGPIMGIGLGLGIFDFNLIKKAFKNLLVAVLISLFTSTIYFLLTPLQEARSELLARTVPTIWDVLIAFFGGLAGIVAGSRKNISNAIPGVAIATALMPPLCTAGYGLGTGNFYFFIGAFYLFLINCVFISLSTFLIVRFLKFKPVEFLDHKREAKVRKYIWTIVLLTLLPSIFLAYKFVGEEIFKQHAQLFITKELKEKNILVIEKTIDAVNKKIELAVYAENSDDSTVANIAKLKYKYDIDDAEIIIKQTLSNNNDDLISEKSNEMRELEARLREKDRKIEELNSKVTAAHKQAIDPSIYNEFIALFGQPQELAISKTLARFSDGSTDTLTIVYFSGSKSTGKINTQQLENWLKERTHSSYLRVVTN